MEIIASTCRNLKFLSFMKQNWSFLKSPVHCFFSSALPLIPGTIGNTGPSQLCSAISRSVWWVSLPAASFSSANVYWAMVKSERTVIEETPFVSIGLCGWCRCSFCCCSVFWTLIFVDAQIGMMLPFTFFVALVTHKKRSSKEYARQKRVPSSLDELEKSSNSNSKTYKTKPVIKNVFLDKRHLRNFKMLHLSHLKLLSAMLLLFMITGKCSLTLMWFCICTAAHERLRVQALSSIQYIDDKVRNSDTKMPRLHHYCSRICLG